MASKCALCGRRGNIRQSHITPKFASKLIKDTSATGYLSSAADGSKRVQDGKRVSLLCDNCEERFSKSEKYFAENVFYQYHNKGTQLFNYDKNLEYFATSLSWRSLKVTYNEAVHDQPHFTARLDRAEACWREFLLGQRQHIEPHETHLLFIENELGRGGFRVNECSADGKFV